MEIQEAFSLHEKVSIVTGGGRGLGKAIAVSLAKCGSRVGVCARTAQEIAGVVEEIHRAGGESLPIKLDITKENEVKRSVESIIERWGRIDILVNNAGISKRGDLMDISGTDWNDVIATNLTGILICCREVGKYMIRQQYGKIITISSTAGLTGGVSQGPYHVSKAGVIMLTKCLALEMGPYNITVNCIAPGYIKTEPTKPHSKDIVSAIPKIPLKRYGYPNDVVASVIFLASNASNYVTGQTIVIDGGLTAGLV